MRILHICPNAYYNYIKSRKSAYYAHKEAVKQQIQDIYHSHNGVVGYRAVKAYLLKQGCCLSTLTVHKYMNKELGLKSIVRPKKPAYEYGKAHTTFENNITRDLAIRTLKKALDSQPMIQGELILHSDQGVQFTPKAFTEFCKENNITQSMSKAGYPYDNAPMERYFNTLKNECINLYEFKTEEALYKAVSDFAYVEYNYVRPHSYNNYATPHKARIAS